MTPRTAQTFIMTKVSYNALPMAMFTTLQKRAFPAYFRTQTLLVIATALTFPPGSLIGLSERWQNWVPLLVNMTCAMLNTTVFGPRTKHATIARRHQGEECRNAMPSVFVSDFLFSAIYRNEGWEGL
jgi:hypothetical protein